MADWNIFAAIDVSIRDLLGGFAGGVVNALVFTRTSPWTAIGSMIVGALTAAYLTDAAVTITGISPKPASFIVGLGGMAICQGIIGAIRSYKFGGALSNGNSK